MQTVRDRQTDQPRDGTQLMRFNLTGLHTAVCAAEPEYSKVNAAGGGHGLNA